MIEVRRKRKPLNSNLRTRLLREGKWTCRYCGFIARERANEMVRGLGLKIDHYIPVCRGGTDDPSNLVVACNSCNSEKAGKLPFGRFIL